MKLIDEAIKVAKQKEVELPSEIFAKDIEAAVAKRKGNPSCIQLQKIKKDGML